MQLIDDRCRGGGRPKVDLSQRTTESLRARDYKHANKGRIANHNRKAAHSKKMAKGGFRPAG